jgi:hypothetical protein
VEALDVYLQGRLVNEEVKQRLGMPEVPDGQVPQPQEVHYHIIETVPSFFNRFVLTALMSCIFCDRIGHS